MRIRPQASAQVFLDFASAVATLKCTRLGGRTGIPLRVEAMKFLKSTKGQQWKNYASDTPAARG